jgi:phosphoglycolate phosphatase-like HAD superfamily hydrolase
MGVRAFFFDVDGTLVDSNEPHVVAWHETLLIHAREVSMSEIRKQIGEGGDNVTACFLTAAKHCDGPSTANKDKSSSRGISIELRPSRAPPSSFKRCVV